jgi:hypothetical protein
VVLHKHVGLQLAVTAHKQTTGRDNPEGDSEEDLPDMRPSAIVISGIHCTTSVPFRGTKLLALWVMWIQCALEVVSA